MNKGQRVGAIFSAKDSVVQFLGYGEYVGDKIPPANIGGFNLGLPNPKIRLDNGEIVWGCECWWGPEEKIRKSLELYDNIVTISIEEERQQDEQI